MRILCKLLIAASAIIVLSGSSCSKLAKNIVDVAPPARTPILISTEQLFKWNGDQNLYRSPDNFQVTIKIETNSFNRVSINSNGMPLPEFDGNNPANDKIITHTSKSLISPNGSNFNLMEYRLFYPTSISSRVIEGSQTFQFVETSINPQYSGTPSAPLSVPIVTWKKQCFGKADFDTPIFLVGETKKLTLKGNNCKQIQIEINGRPFQTLEATGTSTDIDEMLNVEVKPELLKFSLGVRILELKITGIDPIQRKLVSYATVVEKPMPICPSNSSNSTGQYVWYPYCVACPSTSFAWYVSDGTQQACSREDATNIVQNAYSNCSVSSNLGSQFAVCTQCAGQSASRDLVGACTETQALEMVRAVVSSSCVVSACP